MTKHYLPHGTIMRLAHKAGDEILRQFPSNHRAPLRLYAVPRGGVPAAYAIAAAHPGMFDVTSELVHADAIVDDLIDSGRTMERLLRQRSVPFVALLDKRTDPRYHDQWIIFPWEGDAEASIEDVFTRLIQYIGDDPTREGLRETPARMARAWEEWGSGYGVEPSEVLKTFEDGANGYDEMILERDIPFVSHCEHHMAQFRGTVDIAYVPDKRIVGLSKLTRLVEVFARRLQVQERMTTQLADALVEGLNPKGVGVIIKASHSCIESRGVRSHGQSTITCAVRGVIKDKPEARAEFLAHTR